MNDVKEIIVDIHKMTCSLGKDLCTIQDRVNLLARVICKQSDQIRELQRMTLSGSMLVAAEKDSFSKNYDNIDFMKDYSVLAMNVTVDGF